MPDIAVVLGNGAVRGEHASLGNVHKALAPPARGVAGVIAECLSLAHNVGIEVRQGLEPVLVDQLMMQTVQAFRMTGCQHFRTVEEINGTADVGIVFIPLSGNVVVLNEYDLQPYRKKPSAAAGIFQQ